MDDFLDDLFDDHWYLLPVAGLGLLGWVFQDEASAWWNSPAGDDVRLFLTAGGAALVVGAVGWVVWRVRAHRAVKAKKHSKHAVTAAGLDGSPVITNRSGTTGYIKRNRDAKHMSELNRVRLEKELTARFGTLIRVGQPDKKNRVPFCPAAPDADNDRLRPVIEAIEPAQSPDVRALPIGRRADGTPWTLRLLGTHVLVAGVSGAGKGSVLWSLLGALAACLHDGSVQVWAVDPKGGMELSQGEALFTRYADDSDEQMVELLEDAVRAMRRQAKELKARKLRKFIGPSVDLPMVVVLIDEMADFTLFPDRDLVRRANTAIGELLRKGRAVGFVVVGALQDPKKEIVPFRQLFPTKIGLRLDEARQVDMVLGAGARARGALCDEIPDEEHGGAGVAYVVLDGKKEPTRVRAAYVTDDDIERLVKEFPAP